MISSNEQLKKNIAEILNEKVDKPLSENTIKSYYARVKWIKEAIGSGSNQVRTILKEPTKIINAVEESNLALSSKALTYVSLAMLSRRSEMEPKITEQYEIMMNDYKIKNDNERRNNKIKDKGAWAQQEEIESVFDKMPEEKFSDLQDKVIIGLYTQNDGYVLRLDYAGAKVYDKEEDRKENWIYKKPNGYTFYLNDYKTNDAYKTIKFDIKGKLKDLLDKWFTVNKSGYLLVNYRDKKSPLSETSLSKRIKDLFKKYLDKSIGNQELRSIRESATINSEDYNKMDLNEKIELHKNKLQHSFSRAHEYMKR